MSEAKTVHKHKIKRILDLLRFVLTLDDQEIIKSTIESVIEELEEEIRKPKK